MKTPKTSTANPKRPTALPPARGSADGVIVEIIEGVGGPCVAINDRRVAGPKPWGGGKVIMRWKTTREQIMASLPNVQDQAQCDNRTATK